MTHRVNTLSLAFPAEEGSYLQQVPTCVLFSFFYTVATSLSLFSIPSPRLLVEPGILESLLEEDDPSKAGRAHNGRREPASEVEAHIPLAQPGRAREDSQPSLHPARSTGAMPYEELS